MTESISQRQPQTLQPQSIPLYGRHLIEASAGTGKTYNITRIYLRLLLERKLDVKNILVMTFTRAATEELRARIAAQLREVLDNWGQFDAQDEFYQYLVNNIKKEDMLPVVSNALLHLDEASIFTIHGFCNRVLSQQAFSSGVAFNLRMEAETTEIEMDAVRDWYRLLALNKEAYALISAQWPVPEDFYTEFHHFLVNREVIHFQDEEHLLAEIAALKKQALETLQQQQTFLFAELLDQHKKKDERYAEWQQLIQWLKQTQKHELQQPFPAQAAGFINASRFGRKAEAVKAQIISAFEPLKRLREKSTHLAEALLKAQGHRLATEGIDQIRKKIIQAKQQQRIINYDDLISYLLSALNGDSGPLLAQQIRAQFPIALVDEFQDTDPQQYAILNRIYSSEASTSKDQATALYMIGDPKQAIYSFRNGDVFTYLSAADNCDAKWVMDTNWRSSANMIQAYNRLFYGAPLDNSGGFSEQASDTVFGFNIAYTPVKAAAVNESSCLKDEQSESAIHYTLFAYNEEYADSRSKKDLLKQDFCPVIADWCSQEIHRLINQPVYYQESPIREKDIAILVRDRTEAAYMRAALARAGYASVYLSSHDNVFYSDEARELEIVLTAVLELENEQLLIRGLASCFTDCDTEKLYWIQQQEELWEQYREAFMHLRAQWYRHGFMAMALNLLHQHFHSYAQNHERALTNIMHLFELLQQASQHYSQPEQLLNWFREQRHALQTVSESELRLESDAGLIQIITQHGAKGLEYPVVFIPYATRYKDPGRFNGKNLTTYQYHDPHTRALKHFMGFDQSIIEQHREEALAESIRLFYVAVTRAKQRCYICAAPFKNAHLSALGKTLKLDDETALETELVQLNTSLYQNSPEDTSRRVMQLQIIHDTEFTNSRNMSKQDESVLAAAQFKGRIERNWWLSSFSALTRNLRHGGLSLPDRDQQDNLIQEPLSEHSQALRFCLIKGAAAGNLLHDIFEHTDFSRPDWARVIERPLSRFTEALEQQRDEFISWLDECLHAPLEADKTGPLSLSLLHWPDTLREVEFYFPMEQLKLTLLSQLLSDYRRRHVAGNAEYQDSTSLALIQLPGYHTLQGMMHGFIDLVFHWQGKYYIADYKSSWLGDSFIAYQRDALQKNIEDNYYDLQYLIYSLALHRYLKNRLSDYQPEKHLGGVYYLYLRGMNPANDSGVFYTRLDIEMINRLDNLFADELSSVSEKKLK